MAEDVGKQLEIGLGFKINDVGGGLVELTKNAEEINKVTKRLADNLAKLENSYNNNAKSSQKATKASISYIENLRNEVETGLDLEKAYDRLRKKREALIKVRETVENKKEYQELTAVIAAYNRTLGEWFEKLGKANRTVASSLADHQNAVKTLKNEYVNGFTTAERAIEKLKKQQISLKSAITKSGTNSASYGRLNKQLSDVNKGIAYFKKEISNVVQQENKLIQQAAKEKEKIEQQTYNDAKEKNKLITKAYDEEQKRRRKSARESAEFFKEQFKQEEQAAKQSQREITAFYKQSVNERKASSRALNETYGNRHTLSDNVLNATLQVSGIRAITNEFINLNRAIIDIEYNTINNQRLMGDFSSQLGKELTAGAAEIARNTGILITDAQQIQGAWIRINDEYAKSPTLLSKISEITSKFMNVGEIEDAEGAVKLLNASLLQFNIKASDSIEFATEFANKWAYMADITAMGTADEYGLAISKFGAQVKALNGSMDDAIALASTMADKLAKDGAEAGNSLKTITTYLNRDKTLKLFSSIAKDLGDTNYELADANGKLKDFDNNLRTVAKAYKVYKDMGNDVMAQQVLNTLGATRQRDAALAVINSVNDGSYDQYLGKIQGLENNNYLEEQNAALMSSLKNQFNEFVVTLQEAGMVIANSGIISGAKLMINTLTGLLQIIKLMPSPMMTMITGLYAWKAGLAGLEKIGEITGYTEKLWKSVNVGSKAQIESAMVTKDATDAFLNQQKIIFGTASAQDKLSSSYITQLTELKNYEDGVTTLNNALNNGSITAQEYEAKMGLLRQQYQEGIQSAINLKDTESQVANAKNRVTQATQSETMATHQNSSAKNKNLLTLMKENGYLKANQLLKKLGIKITKSKTASVIANTVAKTKNYLATKMESSNLVVATTAKYAYTGATMAATAATTALGVALNILLSPMALITAGMAAFSWIMGASKRETEALQNSIDDYTESINEAKTRVAELKEKQRASGLSGTEEAELEYLREKVALEERELKIKQQEQANKDYQGSGALWWREKGQKDEINELISRFQNLKASALSAQEAIEGNHPYMTAEQGIVALTNANENLIKTAKELDIQYKALSNGIENEKWSGKTLDDVKAKVDSMTAMIPEVKKFVAEYDKINQSANLINADNVKLFNKEISEAVVFLQEYDESIQKLIEGASSNDLIKMMDKYEGFSDVVGKSTFEQINHIRSLANQSKQSLIEELNAKIEEFINSRDSLQEEIAQIKQKGVLDKDDKVALQEKEEELRQTLDLLDEVIAKKDIVINVTTNLDASGLGDLMSHMDSLVESTKGLVEAQNQLANGAALSKEKLWELAMQYPEMLYQANLFADGSVSGQQAAVDAILNMKNQEFNNSIDLKIAELKANRELGQSILELEQQKLQAIVDGEIQTENAKFNIYNDTAGFIQEYNNLIGQQHTLAKQQEVDKSVEADEKQVEAQNQSGEKQVEAQNNASKAIGQSMIEGAAAGVDGLNRNTNNAAGVIGKLVGWAWNAAKSIAGMFAGKQQGAKPDGTNAAGDRTNTFTEATYNSVDSSINGMSISAWIEQEKQALKNNIKDYEIKLGQLDNAIANLESFKNQGLGGVSNNYSDKGASGGTGSDKKGKNDAEKAAEKITKAIEKLTEQYVKNVEAMQNRIVKALKKKYQEQYDERKKLLEKEHNDRVAQIQAEIDKINGNTPEDKKSNLANLKTQLDKWKKDDSTLGKAKQKEYMDKIAELEKEIKIDELEQQMEDENDRYDKLLDQDSEFYDSILKKLDSQMTEEMLYREANDMIRNGKIDEITALLTKYDAQWDGWATLMGKTAGEIISEEVAKAISNYIDVMKGTVTPEGGATTNATTGGSSSSTSTSSNNTSTSGNVTIGSRVNAGSAFIYAYKGSGPSRQYFANDPIYNVIHDDGSWVQVRHRSLSSGITGWFKKSDVRKFDTGGYTGLGQGLAMLHEKERVLNARQTMAFENLIYNQLPKLSKLPSVGDFGGVVNNFNKELVKIDVDTINNYTETDIKNSQDNLDRLFRVSLQKSGIRTKR